MARHALLVAAVALCATRCGLAHYFEDPTLSGAFPLDTASLQEVASTDLDASLVGALASGEGPNCTVTCNGEEYGALDSNKSGKGVDCWGTFKAFCKGHSEKACGFGGFKCEGHFVGFKAPCGAKIGICAGDSKKFAKALIKTEHGPVKIFKAGGGIGTSGVTVAGPNLTLPTTIQWPESLQASLGLQELYVGQGNQVSLLEKGPLTLKKAFGDGVGGGFVAIKKVSAEDEARWAAKHAEKKADQKTFDKLEKKALRKMQKYGVRVPVETSYTDIDLRSLVAGGGCSVTCNGKPAWFKGGFPCFGELKVECAIQTDEEELTPLTQTEVEAQAENLTITSKAGCKGFWSGVFGHKCKGFSYSKVAVKAIDKYAYCSGKKSIFAKKRDGAFVAGGGCFGKGLYAVQYTPESRTQDASA